MPPVSRRVSLKKKGFAGISIFKSSGDVDCSKLEDWLNEILEFAS